MCASLHGLKLHYLPLQLSFVTSSNHLHTILKALNQWLVGFQERIQPVVTSWWDSWGIPDYRLFFFFQFCPKDYSVNNVSLSKTNLTYLLSAVCRGLSADTVRCGSICSWSIMGAVEQNSGSVCHHGHLRPWRAAGKIIWRDGNGPAGGLVLSVVLYIVSSSFKGF